MNDNFNSNALLTTLSLNIAEKTGIDMESAGKVVNWLVSEGVLDMPVVADEFSEEV